jgi:hypothetical protein
MNKCCICGEQIERQLGPDGTVAWDKGHNPAPVMDGDDDRCCGQCNASVVLPERLKLAGIDPDTVKAITGTLPSSSIRSKPFMDGTTEPPGAPLEDD